MHDQTPVQIAEEALSHLPGAKEWDVPHLEIALVPAEIHALFERVEQEQQ